MCRAPMPTPRSDLVVAVIHDLLYAVGGNDGAPLATVEVYDPTTNAWTARASMPTARVDAQGAVKDGRLYVVGGYSGTNTPRAELEVYTP